MREKVVVIGGGTGTYQALIGLKKFPLDISAVISMADSGGSTGRLRAEHNILPLGDVRRAILALSDLPFAHGTLEEVFDFRFDNGKSLRGHSVGNILLAALTQITGSMEKAIEEAGRILNVSGKIYPATLDKSHLVAVLADGSRVYGEKNIDKRKFKIGVPIKKVYLNPKAKVYTKAAKCIKEADVIVLGPGDLFTSIIPVLLVEGVFGAIKKSKGKLIYVMNLVNKRSETRKFAASDFIEVIENHLAGAKLDVVLINKPNRKNGQRIMKWYKKHGSHPVVNDLGKRDFKVIERDFFAPSTFLRHDPNKLARAILSEIHNAPTIYS